MKKLVILAMALVLTAALFAACGCTNTGSGNASTPTGMTDPMPTVATTQPTTRPTIRPTQPSTQTESTGPMQSDATVPSGTTGESGTLQETRGASGTVQGRERGVMPHGGR